MAKLIKANGEVIENYPSSTLAQMQEAVKGFIEPVYTHDNVALVNEEGLLRSLPYNEKASQIMNHSIVGDVLLLTWQEWNDRN